MANYPPAFLNGGKVESLRPSDGGIEIEVIDCPAVSSPVVLFPTVTSAGSLALFAAFDGTAGVGAASSVFAFQGALTAAEGIVVTGATVLNGAVALGGAPGHAITFVGEVAGNIVFEDSTPRVISVDSQALTLATLTTGKLSLNGATEVEVNTPLFDVNAGSSFSMQAPNASDLTVTGAVADLTLGARGSTVKLNEATQTTLSGLFSATSLIGALNELKDGSGAITILAYQSSEGIAPGDVVGFDWDAGNGRLGVYLADNTVSTRQRPVGIALNGGGIGAVIRVATVGEVIVNTVIAANEEGNYVYLGTGGALLLVAPSVPGTAVPGDTSHTIGIVSGTGVAGVATISLQIHEPHVL